MPHPKAQAALDFLMTYGWALLIIFLVASTLFALNIIDVGAFAGSRAAGFAQVEAAAWRLSSNGAFTLMLRNNAGTDISVTEINATIGQETVSYSGTISIPAGEKSGTIEVGTFPGTQSYGSSYTAKVNIVYTDLATGDSYLDSGTVSGKAG